MSRPIDPSSPNPPRVVFMCGPAGAGKTTVARRLERGGMVRLSFDEVARARGIRSMPLPDEVRADIERELRARLLRLVTGGTDVVLDFSFWSRRMRGEYRALLRPFGIEPETIYLATPRETALARVRARRLEHGDDFTLSEEDAVAYFDHFERPTADEGPLEVIASDAVDEGPFYHGTKADLAVGDLLTAGFRSNYRPEVVMNHVYFTALQDGAGLSAELAPGDAEPRVYVVEPTGSFEDDPNVTDKKFPGNPTRSYRSADPLRIVGEVADWTRLAPEALQEWRDRLAAILADERGEIIN